MYGTPSSNLTFTNSCRCQTAIQTVWFEIL